MGVLTRWLDRRRAAQREQIWSAAAADEAEQAARAQQLASIAGRLHRITAGTILYLRAGEWRRCSQPLPADAYLDVRVTSLGDQVMVDPARPAVWWVGVVGHPPECAWGGDEHPPCLRLEAHVAGIVRSTAHGRSLW
ncbi:hypothetical protein ACN27G_05910 [Plantactinospora sp. WMMB334]|uniref:hypothetical protein n=1 Tax=Plantactinospora sp. WMMB334 TaxID=3404119 RepID=UPI003B94134B